MTVLHDLFVDEYALAGPASLSLLADEYMNMNRHIGVNSYWAQGLKPSPLL